MENNIDEANHVNNSSCLHENDIPGALLGESDQNTLKIPELEVLVDIGALRRKEESQACFEVSYY